MENNSLSLSKMKRLLWMMGTFKIPMIAYLRPKLIRINSQEVELKIRLRRRSRNHLKSMYFGALSVGADVASGLHAFYFAEQSKEKISFAFKSMKVEFLKRAMDDVYFYSKEGEKVAQTFEKAVITKERVNELIKVEAFSQNKELVAVFQMEISIKIK